MNNPTCGVCGAKMKGTGTTKAGTRRWRCPRCGASATRTIGNAAKALRAFLRWLFPKESIADLKVGRATFWRKTAWIWRIWPIAPFTGEVNDVVLLDGIRLRRKAVVPIAVADGRVVAWHLAQTECSSAWAALMLRVPAPKMAVCDGSPGFAKAAAAVWPETRIQRCTFHVAAQVRRCTTLRPRLETGIELGHRQQARRRKGRRRRRRMAFGVQRMVREVGAASQGVHVQGGQEGLRARALAQSQARPEQARQGRHAVRLRGDGAGARRRMALRKQRRRERQRATSRHAQASPRASLAPPRQGDLLVVLCAHRKPASRSRNPTRHANRRRCGRAVRRSVERIEARGRRSGRARNGDRLGGVPTCLRDTGSE